METKVETTNAQGNATATPVETPVIVPATTPKVDKVYTEVDVKAAEERARREAQSKADQEKARIHQNYQQQLRNRTGAAKQAIERGDDPNQWEQGVAVWEKAQMYDQMAQEQAQLAEWQGFVSRSAANAGLDASDPRLANIADAEDLAAKIARAVREDARKELEAERLAAENARQAALQAKVASGDLTVLGGTTAATSLSSAVDLETINAELADLLREPTKNKDRIAKLRARRDKLKG